MASGEQSVFHQDTTTKRGGEDVCFAFPRNSKRFENLNFYANLCFFSSVVAAAGPGESHAHAMSCSCVFGYRNKALKTRSGGNNGIRGGGGGGGGGRGKLTLMPGLVPGSRSPATRNTQRSTVPSAQLLNTLQSKACNGGFETTL